MKIYTRSGDAGQTGLSTGLRVPKDDPLLGAYGTVDELNAVLGLTLTLSPSDAMAARIQRVQSELFALGADLSTPWEDRESGASSNVRRFTDKPITQLEREIDEADQILPPLRNFILPGGSSIAATLHLARTVCRRAERQAVALLRGGRCNPVAVVYLNRLSDWLFVMARLANHESKITDILWKP